MKNNIKTQKGFSLIELMITVAVVGILVAVSIPQYQQFANLSKRSEVVTLINSMVLAETNYFLDRDTYTEFSVGNTGLFDYGMIHASEVKYYISRVVSIDPGFEKMGYFIVTQGNIDTDPTNDVIVRRKGDAGPSYSTYNPDETYVLVNDLTQ